MWIARFSERLSPWHLWNALGLVRAQPGAWRDSVVSHPEQADIADLIEILTDAGVEFIVIGGAAAVLHGAPITTRDLDIVPRRTEQNTDRLVAVLRRLDALVRDPAGRRLEPTRDALGGPGQVLLTTRLGPLDSLGALHDGRGFDDLEPHSVLVTDGRSTIRIVDLPTLIEIKTQAGRPKDRLVLPILLALLEESNEEGEER